ncbi:MAG: hypothetical protein K9M45_05445 [Kiritimatiellales bacterium]|nr:hypothetical protein [Kiritimatiellales bacterium]
MKSAYYIIIAMMISASAVMAAPATYREFVDQEGRTVQARILDYDQKTDMVRIQRDTGKTVRVPATIFSLADQNYIRDWEYIGGFESNSKLKVSCDQKVLEKWKEEDWQDVTYESGDVERELVKTTKFERIAFQINFHNLNAVLYENIKIAYFVYYEQSKGGWDKKETPMEQKSEYGETAIKMLVAKSKRTLETEPVVVHIEEYGDLEWDSDPIPAKGKVLGMRARIYMTTAEGIKLMREISYPESLSTDKYPWKE